MTALLIATPLAAQQAGDAGLRIVVIEGEDAVNIIQQKTAVAPIVEVRDRNNLPVSGATVTFSIGQGASFGGQSTLTVVTNAAGQATATGLTPTAAGAIQIQATATFQGQTAIATIAQSNVLTAAEVATTTTAGAGGTGGGTGGGSTAAAGGGGGAGGISGMTIGIIAGAAGGTLVATQAAGGGGDDSPSTTSTTTPGTTATTPTTTAPTTPAPTTPAPSPGPTSSSFTGPMDGTLNGMSSLTVDGEGFSCAVAVRHVGTATLRTQTASGAITGELTMTGRQTVTSTNCGVATTLIPEAPFSWTAPVTGSGNTVRFTQEFRDTQTIEGIQFSQVASITFNGTIAGTSMTGTLSYNSSVEYSGMGINGRATMTGTINLNLR